MQISAKMKFRENAQIRPKIIHYFRTILYCAVIAKNFMWSHFALVENDSTWNHLPCDAGLLSICILITFVVEAGLLNPRILRVERRQNMRSGGVPRRHVSGFPRIQKAWVEDWFIRTRKPRQTI